MEFGFDNGPHLKDKDRTSKIMSRLFIALLPIILFSIYKNGILPYTNGYTDFYGAIRPILMFILGIGTSVITEIIYFCLVQKKRDCIRKCLKDSYAIFPGLFLVLTLPLNTPLWLVVIGAFVATFIGKLLFGGLGYNIFNPALVGNLFVIASYGALIGSLGGYLNPAEVDTVAGATPLTNLSIMNHVGTYSNVVGNYGTLYDFLFGFIPGSLGETSKLLIILAFLFLAFTKVIKWIIPITYVFVVFLMTFIIGELNGMDIWYPIFNILSGGLLFGAVFMATDPVTSPTTRMGELLFGLGLGLLTVIFRFLTPYPEGVLTSILTMNMLVIILDVIGAKAKFNDAYRYFPIILMLLSILGISLYIGNNIKQVPVADERFHIINKETSGYKTIYKVTQKGFHGPIEAVITIENNKITNIDITSQEETYWEEIVNADYLNKLIESQKNLNDVDTVSGATISSNALKYMITKTLEDYKAK